jgi:hypothetical protein
MTIIIHHHHYHDKDDADRLCRIETAVGSILGKLETLQMSFEDEIARVKAAEDALNAKLDAIKADVEGLMAKVAAMPVSGLTPEQEAALKEVADGLEALAAKAGAIDDMNA